MTAEFDLRPVATMNGLPPSEQRTIYDIEAKFAMRPKPESTDVRF